MFPKAVIQQFGFTYVMALTTCHFGCTAAFMELLKSMKAFEPKQIPIADTRKLSSFCVLSIVFMNLSLANNTVGQPPQQRNRSRRSALGALGRRRWRHLSDRFQNRAWAAECTHRPGLRAVFSTLS